MSILDALDFVRATADHRNWMRSTMRNSLGESPTRPVDVEASTRAILRLARDPAAIAIVAIPHGHADDFVGWVVGLFGGIAYVYVKPDWRRKGLGRHLISMSALDGPVPFAHWTTHASRMAKDGFPCRHDTDYFVQVQKYARTERE